MRTSAAILILVGTALLFAQSPTYRVTHTYALGGDGSWDYVIPDPHNHRLFIARQNRVMVVDEDKGTLISEVADAILYDSASNRVFTLNGDAHSSTVIDPKAGTLITNIPLGGKPENGVAAGDGKVYANLTDTSEVVEIDA